MCPKSEVMFKFDSNFDYLMHVKNTVKFFSLSMLSPGTFFFVFFFLKRTIGNFNSFKIWLEIDIFLKIDHDLKISINLL